MQRKWIVLCSRGRPQLISYPRKWFDSCMHPRPERWCWLRRAAAGLRAGYTGTRAQTVPAALPPRVRVGGGGRESKLRLGLPAAAAESLSTGRRCLVLQTLARPRRVPPAPRPWRSAVTRAKTFAPSTTSPEPPGPRRVRPAPRPRGTSRADTQFQARAPKHPNAPDAALNGNAHDLFPYLTGRLLNNLLQSLLYHRADSLISKPGLKMKTHECVFWDSDASNQFSLPFHM